MPGFSSLVDTFFGRDLSDFLQDDYKGSVPAVNIKEEANSFKIEVAAPGMNKENFDVKVDDKMLIISGNKEESKEEKDEKYNRKEFSYTSFQRSFHLPEMVHTEKIEAQYKDGILQISVPKKEEAKMKEAKRISIS
jgi:HSP20 family protein